MIPEIDPHTPLADILKEHGDKFLPLLPPTFRSVAEAAAARGMTLGQVKNVISVAVRREIVAKAPPEHRALVAHVLDVKE